MTVPAEPSTTGVTFDVLGIGHAIVDVLSHVEERFLVDRALVKGSMALVDAEQSASLYAAIGPAVEVSGGSTANTLAGVASFGGRAAFVGKVRDDELGQVFGHDIRAVGVHYDTAPATSGPETARCLILVSADAQRTMSTYLGASAELQPDDIDDRLVEAAAVTFGEAYLWDAPSARDALVEAMDAARRAGRQVAFSLSDSFCVDRHRADFVALVRDRLDILFANEDEICALYEVDDFDRAAGRAADDVGLAFLTRSAAGSVVVAGRERHVVPAVPVERLADTTGAGDQYAAGVLYGLTAGHDLATSAHLGSMAAAEVISHLGARPEVSLADLAKSLT